MHPTGVVSGCSESGDGAALESTRTPTLVPHAYRPDYMEVSSILLQ